MGEQARTPPYRTSILNFIAREKEFYEPFYLFLKKNIRYF